MRLDPIVIEPYDPHWPELFESQATVIAPLMADVLAEPVQHIGSTSIPAMPAKPIIDMLAVVRDIADFRPVLPNLERVGWVHAPEPGDEERRKWSMCLPTVEHRTHHLHVVEEESEGWQDWLLFRDYLRGHPEQADRYATLKRQLAEADPADRTRYRTGKTPLITEILGCARAWKQDGQA